MLCSNIQVVFLLFVGVFHWAALEVVTLSLIGTAVAAAGVGGWFRWDTLKDSSYCRFTECCNSHYVPYDLNKLQQSFSQRLFGQPLVAELINMLRAHKNIINDVNKGNRKALVVSLHGWSGVGKNYAANMVAEAIYLKGMDSNYVKMFMGEKDFGCNNLEQRKKELIATVENTVKKCPKSLFIFDEIHDMCPSVLDALKPMLDHHHAVDGVDYRDSIFIFISNIGGNDIASNLIDLYNQRVHRSDVSFHNFEAVIRRKAYYSGGFEKASLIAQHLIDHYIPFLPLEQLHVEMCALAAFRMHDIYHPSKKMMEDALSVITYGPTEDLPIFANNGCKRFTRHIPYVITKHLQKDTKTKDEM